MNFAKTVIASIILIGSVYGCLFAFFFVSLMSKTKYGKQLRNELFRLIEKGRKNE